MWVHACVLSHSVVSGSLHPIDLGPPGLSVHGIFQASILEWVAISYSRGSLWPSDQTHVSCTGRKLLYHCTTCEVKVIQSCLTLCDSMDCSPPGSSVHRTLQARILEWVAIPFFRQCQIIFSSPLDMIKFSTFLPLWGKKTLSHFHSNLHEITF